MHDFSDFSWLVELFAYPCGWACLKNWPGTCNFVNFLGFFGLFLPCTSQKSKVWIFWWLQHVQQSGYSRLHCYTSIYTIWLWIYDFCKPYVLIMAALGPNQRQEGSWAEPSETVTRDRVWGQKWFLQTVGCVNGSGEPFVKPQMVCENYLGTNGWHIPYLRWEMVHTNRTKSVRSLGTIRDALNGFWELSRDERLSYTVFESRNGLYEPYTVCTVPRNHSRSPKQSVRTM